MGKTTAGKPNRHKVERVIKETEAAGQQQRRRRYTRCSPQSRRRQSTPQTNCTRNGTDDKGRNFKSGKMGCRQPDNNLGKRYKSTAALFQRQSGWNVRMGARGEHASEGGEDEVGTWLTTTTLSPGTRGGCSGCACSQRTQASRGHPDCTVPSITGLCSPRHYLCT